MLQVGMSGCLMHIQQIHISTLMVTSIDTAKQWSQDKHYVLNKSNSIIHIHVYSPCNDMQLVSSTGEEL